MRRKLAPLASLVAALVIAAAPALAGRPSARLYYRFYCAACHGLKGRGDGPNATKSQPVVPRDHTNSAKMSKLTDKEIIEVIKFGGAATNRSRMMPPFGKTLSDKEITALKDYVRKLCRCRGPEG